jgi:hypothetical protein
VETPEEESAQEEEDAETETTMACEQMDLDPPSRAPVIDDDGFQLVQKHKRKGR